jgi:excisionase family DNA binding protein
MKAADFLAKLEALREEIARLAERPAPLPDVILTREEAARQLKVSVRQLQRLVRAGRLLAHPSGIARAELERYAKTPQTKLTATTTRRASVREDMAQGRAMLRLMGKKR